MEYFTLFDLPISFQPDQEIVKQKFYALSRKHHPDFYAQQDEAEQAMALEKSSVINKAYKTFQNPDEIIKYILKEKGLLQDEEKYELPPNFLMEMMDLNERLMEAKLGAGQNNFSQIRSSITASQLEIYRPVEKIITEYTEGITTDDDLKHVKEYYFKKKYLNRILAAL